MRVAGGMMSQTKPLIHSAVTDARKVIAFASRPEPAKLPPPTAASWAAPAMQRLAHALLWG